MRKNPDDASKSVSQYYKYKTIIFYSIFSYYINTFVTGYSKNLAASIVFICMSVSGKEYGLPCLNKQEEVSCRLADADHAVDYS